MRSLNEIFNDRQKAQMPNAALMDTGNELLLNELILYIQDKKGYVNRKERYKQMLINVSLKNRQQLLHITDE